MCATLITVVGFTVIVTLITGEVALVTTHGISMEPTFHTGDLAVIVPSAHYGVGEIVGYHSPLLHIVVLHRIVAEHAGLFTFKGDNNSFLDPRRLPASAIEGRLFLHIPGGGTVLGWFRSPVVLGILAFLIVAMGVVGRTSRRKRANRRAAGSGVVDPRTERQPVSAGSGDALGPKSTGPSALPVWWWPVGIPLVLAGAFGLLTSVAWARPVTRPSERAVAYSQHITFSYSAPTPPGVAYPTGSVVTADPVFPRLVPTLDVKVHYVFDSKALRKATGTSSALSGTIGATAVLQGSGGWEGRLATVAPVPFSGSTASVDIPVAGVPLGAASKIEVQIEPVPGETNHEGTKNAYLAIFGL